MHHRKKEKAPIMSTTFSVTGMPIMLRRHSLIMQICMVLAGTLWLAASSWIKVPMFPVPMTLQTFALATLAVAYGRRLSALSVLAWLAEGALGLPVFSSGAAGIHYLFGPTGGYLWSFPLIAVFIAWSAEKGWLNRTIKGTATLVAAHALCLACGAAWLALFIGGEQAWQLGVEPFILGSLLKSLLAMVTIDIGRAVCRRMNK